MQISLQIPHVLPAGCVGASCDWTHAYQTACASGSALPGRHAAGRACAGQALAQLANLAGRPFEPVPTLPRLPSGAPAWPAGVVGAITHTALASHALVGWRRQWRGLGIDSEARLDLAAAQALLQVVADAAEQALVLATGDVAWATTALFSAKEAFYKASASVDARAIEFDAVRLLAFAPGVGGATQLLLQPAAFLKMGSCVARVLNQGSWLHSSVCLPA